MDTSEWMGGKERCARCGCEGYDRRTLKMACSYRMDELNRCAWRQMPLESLVVFTAPLESLEKAGEPTKIETSGGKSIALDSGTVTCNGELTPQVLYTLRVCKPCRASWMESIQHWFEQGSILADAVRESIEDEKEGE